MAKSCKQVGHHFDSLLRENKQEKKEEVQKESFFSYAYAEGEAESVVWAWL